MPNPKHLAEPEAFSLGSPRRWEPGTLCDRIGVLHGDNWAGTFAQWASDGSKVWLYADGVLAHAAVGCGAAAFTGGNCSAGALSAAVAQAAGPLENAAAQWGGRAGGTVAAGIVGGLAARAVNSSFDDGFSVAAAGYLFNQVGHEVLREERVAELSAKLTNAQVAATLKFFNPGDPNPYTAADLDRADQSTIDSARHLAAVYIVSGTWAAAGIGTVDKFAKPPTGYVGLAWEAIRAFFGYASPQFWTWSTDITKFQGQLSDRFGSSLPGTIRSDLSSVYQEQYYELKNGM